MPENLIVGWEKIHQLFCDEQGKPVMALTTLQQRYGRELRELGIVFRYNPGRAKRPIVAAWPSKVRNWWTKKQQEACKQREQNNFYVPKKKNVSV